MTPEEKKVRQREYAKAYYLRNADLYKQRATERAKRLRNDPARLIQTRRATRKWFAKKELDPDWVEKRRAQKRAAYAKNPEPQLRVSRALTPEQRKRYQLKHKYGITLEEFETMLEAQGHRCAICLCTIEKPIGKSWRGNFRAVDHDHNTDKVRSVLCRRCNVVLGQVGDSAELLEAFIAYLKRHQVAVA